VWIVRHLNVVAAHGRCVSSSILGEKDAGKSDPEAFEYSNREAGPRYLLTSSFLVFT
jgi:hypothetical protein